MTEIVSNATDTKPPVVDKVTNVKPFSCGYVMRVTARHIRKAIDISIRKTFERMAEFKTDEAKGKEVFLTLAHLHSLRKWLDDYQAANQDVFASKDESE